MDTKRGIQYAVFMSLSVMSVMFGFFVAFNPGQWNVTGFMMGGIACVAMARTIKNESTIEVLINEITKLKNK